MRVVGLAGVQMLRCPRCRDFTVLEALDCAGCGLAVGFHPPTLNMHEATPECSAKSAGFRGMRTHPNPMVGRVGLEPTTHGL